MAHLLKLTLASGALFAGLTTCGAVSLLAGEDKDLPGGSFSDVAGDLLVDTFRPFVGLDSLGHVTFTGKLYLKVVLATSTGKLDFHYKVENDAVSLNSIKRLTTTSFDGFTTDVDWLGTGGTVRPSRGDRSVDDSLIGFRFIKPGRVGGFGLLSPGLTSFWMVIRTNATHYAVGSSSVIDGGVANVDSFAPVTAPVPEPFTLALGAAGLGLAARRRRRA